MRLSAEQILTLQNTPGIGAVTIDRICRLPGPERSESMDLQGLLAVLNEMERTKAVKKLTVPGFETLQEAARKAGRILEKSEALGIAVVTRFDPEFPANLHGAVDESGKPAVPTVLFYKGDLSVTSKPAIAIIGTRNPSREGKMAGEKFGEFFASHGFDIVSGLALGCDAAGHRGALKGSGGSTTAFLAHGLDSIYPPENRFLAEEIVDSGGLLMSEYAIGERVNRNFLISRDRLQAALADATLVIQTGIKGGTMHAVKATLAAGKRVYAVDYKVPILNDCDAGNRWLINGGRALPLRSENEEMVLGDIMKDVRPVDDSDKGVVKGGPDSASEFVQGTLF